ncbi:porin [Elizabethkingia miricola]|uniref:porin n=1 Tax=Elizabethkingia miricola TaxID=172045 RepID=UPI0015C4BD08|nr:porin [Elizabethkingia miricola]
MKKSMIALVAMGLSFSAKAQSSDSISTAKKITFSAYAEVFYSYNFNEPRQHIHQNFLYNFNRHNEINLNLAVAKATYQDKRIRANLALMAGTYPQDNMVAEQGALRYINEANIGVKISENKNLWIDAGIMPSHIGWESAIGKDNYTLTRSIAAENSPYFETGVRLSYTTDNGKWYLSGLVLNGWQRIAKPEGNQSISFGHQVTYKPSEKITLNSSSFIGNDKSREEKRMRYFHDLYGTFQLTDKFSAIAGFDIGAEQKVKGSDAYNIWYSPNLLLKYQLNPDWAIAGRLEYYNDKNGVIINSGTPNGFQTFGYSVNVDYTIFKNVMFRTEARGFTSKDAVFAKNDNFKKANFIITSSLNVWF